MLKLYPPPRKLRLGKGSLPRNDTRLVKADSKIPERLRRALAKFCQRHALDLTFGDCDTPFLTLDLKRGRESEAYQLNVTTRVITLTSTGEVGMFRGLTTLSQILDQNSKQVPCLRIADEPDFEHRGVMLDVSRCKVPTQKTLFTLIEQFAELKLNQLQLYTEHTFPYVNHETVWADASPITPADLIALKQHCNEHYIELVPNQNSFGHFERWLRHPAYRDYAECPDGFEHPFSGEHIPFGSTLKPTRQSLTLLAELYDELLPLFDSSLFNIGGDEPWELGKGFSAKRSEKIGTTQVYVDFLSQIQRLVEARKRTMLFWSDIVLREPASLKKLSRKLVALNWGYEGNHPFNKECAQIAAAKLPFYVCPGTSSWNSLTGRITNATANLDNAARAGINHGAIGYLITDWGDHGHHQYLPISYPGFLLGACHAWHHKGSRSTDVVDGVNRTFFPGQTSRAGELLNRLGHALDHAPSPLRNASIFNRLLFWRMNHEPTTVISIPDEQLRHCEDELRDIHDSLAQIRGNASADLVRAELANASLLAIHAVHRVQHVRKQGGSTEALQAELARGIAEHRRLWLARNRPGGLAESLGHLERSLTVL